LGKNLGFFEKASNHFKKASIFLRMHLKSLNILKKASIFLKKYSERIKIFIKASHFQTKASFFSGNVFKKPPL
jgi:hypothetical protein